MQEKNKANVKKILLAIAEHKKVDRLRGLSALIGINESTLYAWIKRGKIGNVGSILKIMPYLNVNWLETGSGPMMIIDKDNFHLLPPGQAAQPTEKCLPAKIAARIEPGSPHIKKLLMREKSELNMDENSMLLPTRWPKRAEEKQQGPADDETPISEMLVMTSRVLESKTVYRSALASNVRAFYQAVVQEDEMQSLNEKMELMQAQMARMEMVLDALNAALPQKREQEEGADNIDPKLQSSGG